MKIGILTKHSVPNYGAMLQAYALVAALNKLGHDAECVDYDQPATTEYFRPKFSFPPRVNNYLRYYRCKQFVKRHQKRSPEHCRGMEEFKAFAGKYDLLITGSDQVWFTGPVQYYDPMYFLDFPFETGARASYAPSAGGVDSFGEFEPKVRSALAKFKTVSVRDDNTERLVKEVAGISPHRVCDPTFLHDFAELVAPSSPVRSPYLLLFGEIPKSRHPALKAYAKENGLSEIVTLQYKNEGLATRRLAAPSPVDWLTYFKHSNGVATTYFHGTVFAIKFRKHFISIPTTGRIKKVSAVLSDCGLSDRRALAETSPSEFQDILERPVDWAAVENHTQKFIEQSIAYLKLATAPEA